MNGRLPAHFSVVRGHSTTGSTRGIGRLTLVVGKLILPSICNYSVPSNFPLSIVPMLLGIFHGVTWNSGCEVLPSFGELGIRRRCQVMELKGVLKLSTASLFIRRKTKTLALLHCRWCHVIIDRMFGRAVAAAGQRQ